MSEIFIGREPVPERIVVRGVDFTREVVQVLERRQAADLRRADRDLKAAHRAGGERRTIHGKNGDGGEVTHVIHPVHAAMLVNQFGDARCLSDAGIMKDYVKQFPAARVRSRSRKIQVGWNGGSSKWGKHITFRKVY